MKEIVIKCVEDLEQLKSVSKREGVILRFKKEFNHVTFPAISLGRIWGPVIVDFEKSSQKYDFEVIMRSVDRMDFFFTDAFWCNVHFLDCNCFKIHYKLQDQIYEVSNYHEYLDALANNANMILKCDIVIPHDGIIIPSREIKINGQGHYVFAKERVIQQFKKYKNYYSFTNTSFFPVTQVIEIFHIVDFYKVFAYSNETVVLSLENSIEDQVISPLWLKEFNGTIIILGNGHVIRNIKLLNNLSDSIGLISDLSYSANLICSDLIFEKIQFPNVVKENVGSILGARENALGLYAGPSGKTIFSNCSVRKTKMLNGKSCTGIFAGCVDDNAECFDCSVSYILGSPGHTYFGNQAYYDSNSLVAASNFVDKKRIGFQGGSI